MNKKLTIRLLLIAIASIAVLYALREPKKTSKPAEDRLLVIDGLTITFDELKPFVDFYASFRPDGGKKTMTMKALTSHVLPLRLAQRAFPEERRQQYEYARGLSDVATNVLELETHSQNTTVKQQKKMSRMQAKLPVAMFLFDHLRTGSVSEPLEVPTGWFVVGSYELTDATLALEDYVDALQVGFITHTAIEWSAWMTDAQQRIGDKVTFVHPDYRDSMPPWMTLPKDQTP